MLKTNRLLVVLLGMVLASASQAQFLEIIGGYILNSALAKSQEKEVSPGKIVVNVYLERRDGTLQQLPGWDPYSTKLASWPDSVILEPILIVNASKTPDQVIWSITTNQGPLVRQAYLKVDGGRPAKDGGVKDNTGYRQKSPMFRVRDLPKGWFAITASWGKGQAATIQSQRYSMLDTLRLAMDQEALQALSLANGETTPSIPVFTALMPDGSIRYFTSPEEIKMVLATLEQQSLQQQKIQEPPLRVDQGSGSGAGLAGQGYSTGQRPPDDVQLRSDPFEIRVYRYGDSDRKVGDKKAVLQHLASRTAGQRPLADKTRTISLPTTGDGVAILIISTQEMKVEYVSGTGERFVHTNGMTRGPDGLTTYSVLENLTLGRNQEPDGKLLITMGGKTYTIRFEAESQ